ncbi:hypothetical protein V6N11_056977 [Hibiscus sabdariffa]|uniref:Uncharacterized protein n=1 Tax=Hibiscus sabdariffa TaxID=183260 RepID=A0ABR2T5W7_9ROSI
MSHIKLPFCTSLVVPNTISRKDGFIGVAFEAMLVTTTILDSSGVSPVLTIPPSVEGTPRVDISKSIPSSPVLISIFALLGNALSTTKSGGLPDDATTCFTSVFSRGPEVSELMLGFFGQLFLCGKSVRQLCDHSSQAEIDLLRLT